MAAKAKKRTLKKAKWLVFVDTNILLDFYRLGGDSAKRNLDALKRHADSLILTDQVWMEFLKNRQKVILQTIKDISNSSTNMPQLLSELQPVKGFLKHQKEAEKYHKKVVAKIENMLRTPARHDPVYQSLAKLFNTASPLNLKRPNKQRLSVRRLATKRFSLGYPPRKDDTLRLGDSINWEWIIECACSSEDNASVLVVSRDGDFGPRYREDVFLNDWLQFEFKERVSRQRKIELTHRLSTALKRLDVTVSPTDVEEENRIVSIWAGEKAKPWAQNSLLLEDILKRLVEKKTHGQE